MKPKATVIVPVYKDIAALNVICRALKRQAEKEFELILTEDDDSQEVTDYVATIKDWFCSLTHLQQEDDGFRKTVAVNRAIVAAKSDYLIFLDGDCVPHSDFVRQHLLNSADKTICTGRRVDFGPKMSARIKRIGGGRWLYENRLVYLLMAIPLHLDGIRCYELGFAAKWMHNIAKKRYLGLMGCNFSCHKKDMIAINGYDEDYVGSGGEDDDLEWRFNGIGVKAKNIKFLAPVYHLRTPARRGSTAGNYQMLTERRNENNKFVCENGLNKYFDE